MKRFGFFIFLFFQCCFFAFSQNDLNWQFFHPLKQNWFNYNTHGSIQEKLIESKELPEPFFELNEEKFNWIENHIWQLISDTIYGEKSSNKIIDIHFPSIDTYASIYWNDSLVLVAENAFRPYQIQIIVKPNSKNTLKAIFTPPVLYHKEQFNEESFHYPAPNDPNPIAISNLTRKPQYQFGWDWTARMNTIGFLEPVSWNFQKSNSLEKIDIQTTLSHWDSAKVTYNFLFNSIDEEIIIVSKLFGSQVLKSNKAKFEWKNTLYNPKLWWPNGFGNSFLYQDTIQILSKDGILLEKKAIQYGIRKTELVQEKDQWGTSYVLKINEKSIFCKGANIIPPSIFPSQITDSVWEEQIQIMKQQHFNMIRVWGGGIYPSDYFFKRCDEEGIIIWQDFMFACAMYPADSMFLKNIKAEMDFQIPRIAAHPSLILFNGNNEVDVAWKNWGFSKQYHLSTTDSVKIAADYRTLFQENLPKWIKSYTEIPYVHTSPLSNWGSAERYNHGSQHYWGVWHGNDSIEDFSKNIGRFNSEFGFQSFPEYSTLIEIGEPNSWNLDSLGIKKHQKSYVGNGKINSNIDRFFPLPKNFMEFVYYSQLVQANAIEKAVSAHRLNAPRCMGSLYWQLNDCYPGPTWSSVDFLGNRKILHYRVKEVMNPVAVLQEKTKEGFQIKITSDLPTKTKVSFEIFGIVKMNNKVLKTKLTLDTLTMEYLQHHVIFDQQQLKKYFISKNIIGLQVNWSVNNSSFSKILWLNSEKVKLAQPNVVRLKIKKIDIVNKVLILSIHTKVPIRDFWLYSIHKGIRYEENGLQLLPGKKEIQVSFETLPNQNDFRWLGIEL